MQSVYGLNLRVGTNNIFEALQTLNQGAQEGTLAEFDRELKQEIEEGFPSELRAIYLENDGQARGVLCGMFFGLEFLTLEYALMV